MISKRQAVTAAARFRSPIAIGRLFKSTIAPVTKKKEPNFFQRSSYKLYLFAFVAGGTIGLNIPFYSIFNDYIAPLPHPDREADVKQYLMDLENELQSLSIVKQLSKDEKYKKVRAWENFDTSSVFNESMTSSTLRQPGGISIQPIVFINEATKETVTVVHLGKKLTGYPFLVHGGILATVLDETMKRCSVLSFKSKRQHLKYDNESTYKGIKGKHLTLSYKFPTFANSFIVVRSKSEDISPDGKVLVKATIQNAKGRDLVVGDGVFEHAKTWWFW